MIDAAGSWAHQVAAAAGIHVPMVPRATRCSSRSRSRGATPELPIVRIMDAAVYARPCWGSFLAGGYETEPTQFEMERLPSSFSIADTPLDLSVLRRLMEGVREQLPVLSTAPLRLYRGGIPTMTPDGQHIVGPVPGAAAFFVASGCNVAGLSISPVIGEEIARWIVDGRPSEDLGAMSIARFGRSGATRRNCVGRPRGSTGTSIRTTRPAPDGASSPPPVTPRLARSGARKGADALATEFIPLSEVRDFTKIYARTILSLLT